MKSFFMFDVQSTLGQDTVFNLMQNKCPDFSWRRGDSEMQGLYVSGARADGVRVKVWLSDGPMSITVSFADAWNILPDEIKLKQQLLHKISKEVIPDLGVLLKVTER